jgi:guanine deaminase
MIDQIVRGPLLRPLREGGVAYHRDGAMAFDDRGILVFVGPWARLQSELPADAPLVRASEGVILPPLLDLHTHIPQHPIRGQFARGIDANAPGGLLLNALKRNVFPAEAKCNFREHAREVIEAFAADVLSHGVVGGATFMTVSAAATELALEILPARWSVGLVLMNQNTPDDLRTDEANLEADVARIARRFGRRLIITDRFAVAVSSPLRQTACSLAGRFGLRTQTHLNEQKAEKQLVEEVLYPEASSYTDVYRRDGMLDHRCILAHCIHNTSDEWKMLASTKSAIAHCPTSNLLLGSGTMPLDRVVEYRIPYAIATDVGASGTVSILAEMGRFLEVHKDRSAHAAPTEALWHGTLAPARILGQEDSHGRLESGKPASFIEVEPTHILSDGSADDAIRAIIPSDLDNPKPSVSRVTLEGEVAFERNRHHA